MTNKPNAERSSAIDISPHASTDPHQHAQPFLRASRHLSDRASAVRTLSAGTTFLDEPIGHHLILAALPSTTAVLKRTGHCQDLSMRDREGCVSFFPSGTSWTTEVIGGKGEVAVIAIPTELVISAGGDPDAKWRSAHGVRNARMVDAVRWLASPSHEEQRLSAALIKRLLARLAALAFGHLVRRPDDGWLPAAALARVGQVTTVLEGGRATLSMLAREAGLSPSAFSRAFRGSTGITPGDFLIRTRLERASSLISSTDLSIGEVATRVGLASSPHLSEQFRERHGITPGKFRSLARSSR